MSTLTLEANRNSLDEFRGAVGEYNERIREVIAELTAVRVERWLEEVESHGLLRRGNLLDVEIDKDGVVKILLKQRAFVSCCVDFADDCDPIPMSQHLSPTIASR